MNTEKRYKTKIIILIQLFIFTVIISNRVWSQSETENGCIVDQRTHWVAVLTDPKLIKLFTDEFYISEDTISKIEIMDVDNNGFSKGDLIKTYPSQEIYFLDEPSEKIQNIMNKWKFQANYSVNIENTQTPEMLEKIPFKKAEYAIVASFLKGLNRNYKDLPLKAWIERDSISITFQMWGYSDTKLQYTPPPPAGYDIVCVYKTITDTLYIPKK